MDVLSYVSAFAVMALTACVLSLVFTHCLIPILPKLGMLDVPKDNRRVHRAPVPRCGGIGMIVSFLICVLVYAWQFGGTKPALPFGTLRVFLPLCILCPLGIVDDRFALSARWKFLFQMAAAAWCWQLGARLDSVFGVMLPWWGSLGLTVFWITAMINAFNMIDGVDGLAGGIGVVSAGSLAFITWMTGEVSMALVLVTFAGALLGFLRYNWHPAKVFMGDTGSMFIGFVIGVADVVTNEHIATVSSIVVPLLACGVPVIDIFLAVWRRLTSGGGMGDGEGEQGTATGRAHGFLQSAVGLVASLGQGDKSHLHHRLLKYFDNNQPRTVVAIYVLAGALSAAGIVCFFLPEQMYWLGFVITLSTLSLVLHRLAVIELWNSAGILYRDFQRPRMGVMLNVFNPIWDVGAVAFSFFLVLKDYGRHELAMVGVLMAPVCIALVATRNYRVFWNFSSKVEFFRLMKALGCGYVVSWICGMLWYNVLTKREYLYALSVAVMFIIGERLLFYYARAKLIQWHNRSRLSGHHPRKVLLLGITQSARLYINRLNMDMRRVEQEDIIGFLEQDMAYRHSYCLGQKVLGTLKDLKRIHEQAGVGKVVVCNGDMAEDDWQFLVDYCKEQGIELTLFRCKEISVDELSDHSTGHVGSKEDDGT